MYTYETLQGKSIYDLRRILRSLGGVPGGDGKEKIMRSNIENKNASCVGLSIRCKGRHCKKIIPIVIKDGEQVEPM